jgi:hypothetical protein
MNTETATITMDRSEAREKLREYRRGLHRRADEVWSLAAKGFEELAEGHTLIDVDRAIRDGGFFSDMGPKLAIARADRKVVEFFWYAHQNHAIFDSGGHRTRQPAMTRSVDMRRTPDVWNRERSYMRSPSGYSLIPAVPPDVRSKAVGGLKNYWTLFEVEKWHNTNPTDPPVDPYLLRHVGGSLYAIVAEWELTELERSVAAMQAI